MRKQIIILSLLSSLTASGCRALECADGTIERDGRCEPSTTATDPALCGPFTELVGDRCVPQFPPTICEDGTTEPDTDPETGVTTCKGTGMGSCSSPVACPTPSSSSKMTICGQLYDFETNALFAATGASGVRCNPMAPTPDGPCALGIQAYNAVEFAQDPQAATPLPITDMYIDDCGRYRISEIDLNAAGPFVGLGIDDIADPGPAGVTVTAAVATQTRFATATKGLEAWIVKPSTTQMWVAAGATLSTGIYAPIFRAHKAGHPSDVYPFPNQADVTLLVNGTNTGVNDYYFPAAATNRQMLDGAATSTGANGTVLMTNATLDDGTAPYGGQGGLGSGCRWEPHAGASLPGIVFIQVFRKLDAVGQTCND